MTEPAISAAPTNVKPLRGHNVVAVASGKGGVGKTFFSITLSHALARLGRKTLLFDGDLGLANVDIQLGLTPEHDLGMVIDGRVTLQRAAERFKEGGFDIIAGRSGSGSLAQLPSQQLTGLRNDLLEMARSYDTVVMDMGAGVDRTVRNLAGPAGTTLVVTTDEPTSITDAYAFIKITRATNPASDLRIVVNLAQNTKEGERTYGTILKACQNFLKFAPPLAGIVRRDIKVRDAIRNQTPLLLRSPSCDAARDVEAVANRLVQSV
jgi:flagellar biosynthesis protein FlhG